MAVFENLRNAESHIRERSAFLFNNDLLSDVSFVVPLSSSENDAKRSKMVIPAHKFLLSVCSPVFYAMFCGEMAEKSDTIDLPDCEYEGVMEMLRYLYSEEVKLNEGNVLHVLYVAKKYMLPSLADKCVVFLMRNLDVENVLCVLSHAKQYEEKRLVDRCWETIDRETEEVVKSEGFATIDKSLLEAMVKRDTLTISEVELFKAVDLWATKECERQGVPANGNVKRRILGDQIVKKIHFPAMEEGEFSSAVLQSNILTNREVKHLMKNFKGVLNTPVGFPEVRRAGTCLSCCRFVGFCSCICNHPLHPQSADWNNNHDGDDMNLETICLHVDKDILLHGIRFFGCSNGREYCISLKIRDLETREELFALEDESYSSVPLPYKEAEISGFDVMFEPVVLRKDVLYGVKSIVHGPATCFGCDGANTIQSHGVTFNFMDYGTYNSIRVSETTVEYGQFACFFFKPL